MRKVNLKFVNHPNPVSIDTDAFTVGELLKDMREDESIRNMMDDSFGYKFMNFDGREFINQDDVLPQEELFLMVIKTKKELTLTYQEVFETDYEELLNKPINMEDFYKEVETSNTILEIVNQLNSKILDLKHEFESLNLIFEKLELEIEKIQSEKERKNVLSAVQSVKTLFNEWKIAL